MRPLTSPEGEPTKAVYIFTNMLLGLINNRRPDMLIVAMDSKAPSFRTKIYTEYKAHRPPMPDDMPTQIDRIEEVLCAMNIPVLRLDGFEADDLIGTVAKKASADGVDVFICSKDKDMLQLLDKRINTFDVKTGEAFGLSQMAEEMKMTPQQFIEVLALQGDTADNIPGVADVGPKTALGWIQEYGSIENLYKHADKIKGKRGESLRGSKEVVALSIELVRINVNSPVEIDYDSFALKKFDEEELVRIFTELGFSRLLKQLSISTEPAAAADEKTKLATGKRAVEYKLIDTEKEFVIFLAELKKQKLFAVDTETTSIDPCRAELVGMSFSWRQGVGYYIPVRGPLGSKHLDLTAVRRGIGPVLANEKIKKIGQNIKYDIIVLRNAQMPLKGVCFDTMVASYCLDPLRNSHSMDNMARDFLDYETIPISALIGKGKNQLSFDMVDTAAASEYAAEDADITWRLYGYLKERLENQPSLKKLFEDLEMPLVEVLAAMEFNGVSIDYMLLERMSGQISDTIGTLTEDIYKQAGCVFNIDSPKQLGEVLFDKLGLSPIAIGKTGRSTNAAVLEELAGLHPIIELTLQYRRLVKLKNTYIDKLGLLINPRTGRVHTSFNQTITATGRLSSSDPNLQNIPIRTELGKKIRSAFVPAEKTDCILSADYSQVELRLLAHFSKDKALSAAFAADKDIHRFVASQIYGVPIEEVTDKMRSSCKAVNFGIIYGQGPFGLSRSTGMSLREAKKFIDDYFARYSSIRQFMDLCIAEARRTGYAETILGRRREIANLNGADLIKVAMINIQRKIETESLPVKLILQVHDELVFELPEAQAEKHSEWIEKEMTEAIRLDVPLKVDVSIGPTWLAD
jgi:DNA polymerase-1